MKRKWTIICVAIGIMWACPFTMIFFGGLVPMENTKSNILYALWYNPADQARIGNWIGFIPSILWIVIAWILGILIIKCVQRLKRSCK